MCQFFSKLVNPVKFFDVFVKGEAYSSRIQPLF